MSVQKEREVPVRIIYRKKGHGHGHHGGAWKVAFADFMTAMFAMFLVLWLVNQSSDVKAAIAGYFQDPLGRANEFGSSIVPGEGAQAQVSRPLDPSDVTEMRVDRMESMARRLAEAVRQIPALEGIADQVEITVTDEGLEIQLLEDSLGVFFHTASADPSLKGRQILALLGQELGRYTNGIRVEGHTDAMPYDGRAGYGNWELSADRANAARRILTRNGVDDAQVVEIRGHADRELHDPGAPFAASNRRVTITLLLSPAELAAMAAAPDSTAPAPPASKVAHD
jgi:chemotaxis protein MotB